MKIAFFGSSLVSAYWNGAATYYRGILKALHAKGHDITFYEPDAYSRQQHRDIDDPEYAKVVVYDATEECAYAAIDNAADADLIVKASGVGIFDELLERELLRYQKDDKLVVFWDVDAPATLDRVQHKPEDPFKELIPQYDLIFTYGGGQPVIDAYKTLGAKDCVPIYNALDTDTHYPVNDHDGYRCDLAFLGNRLPDREARVEEFFLNAAKASPNHKFIIGGSGWDDKPMPTNVKHVGHVYTRDHNAFNCTPKAVLNISRESMARYGFSPATRVFEAAGAAACIITDYWVGIDQFFEPGKEILVVRNGEEVAEYVAALTDIKAREIGEAAYRRVLSEHTYTHRAALFEKTVKKIWSQPKAAVA